MRTLASGGKLRAFGVDGNSTSDDIIAALRLQAAGSGSTAEEEPDEEVSTAEEEPDEEEPEPTGDNFASLSRSELRTLASGGKLRAFGVDGNSTSDDIIAALRRQAADSGSNAQDRIASLSAQLRDANRRYHIPSGALAEMVANMSDDWASSEDELNFAEESDSEELVSDQLQFAESSAVEHNESGSLEFAESSAIETDSDSDIAVQTTSEKTSSGLEFAESSAVDSDSSKEHGSSSGLGWAESSDYD